MNVDDNDEDEQSSTIVLFCPTKKNVFLVFLLHETKDKTVSLYLSPKNIYDAH